MSASIDERIVSMKFDNKQFEKGVKQSLGTIESLKKSMNFDQSVKNMETLQKATKDFNVDSASKSLTALEKRFSNMGVVGMTVIQNLTNSAVNMAKNFSSKVVSPITNAIAQIKSGGLSRALNLEQANFQLMGLLNNASAVTKIIGSGGPVQEAVSGTAFGLDQAAVAASQLVASGMKTEELLGPLKAIAGVASMTGREYGDIAQIFTTVKSNGKFMTEQMRQLSYSGINAAATLSKYLNKTEQEINDMVSHGEISFETFSAAMQQAFGENAARANDTFNGALANMKAALSRIGADVAGPALEDLRDLFNAVRPMIDEVHEALKPALEYTTYIIKTLTGLGEHLLKDKQALSELNAVIKFINGAVRTLYDLLDPLMNLFASKIF